MANSFNISVKPEIAAVQAVVDANSVILTDVHNTDLPSVKADTADIRNDVTAIHDTDLPAVYAGTVSNNTILADIHGVDLPAAVDEINANEAKIDSLAAVAAAIQAKTDAMPQNVRGKFYSVSFSTSSATFVEALNVTGHGILYMVGIRAFDADNMEVRITMDGLSYLVNDSDTLGNLNTVLPHMSTPQDVSAYLHGLVATEHNPFNMEFDETLLVELRRESGTAGTGSIKIYYNLDRF